MANKIKEIFVPIPSTVDPTLNEQPDVYPTFVVQSWGGSWRRNSSGQHVDGNSPLSLDAQKEGPSKPQHSYCKKVLTEFHS